MKKLPRENKTGAVEYCYKRSQDKKAYALFAMLENTSDSQCIETKSYDCGGNTNAYCFAYYSPNVAINDDGDFTNEIRVAPTVPPVSTTAPTPTSAVGFPPTSTPVPTKIPDPTPTFKVEPIATPTNASIDPVPTSINLY